ncbi:MAG: hypothetical protein SGBAC_011551 [Bacillariaceae sp.]
MPRRQRAPRVDLSDDKMMMMMMGVDSTSLQESFLLEEETRRKIEQVPRSEYRGGVYTRNYTNNNNNNNNGYESCESDDNFMLHCTSPVSHTSTITMDLLLSSSSTSGDSISYDDIEIPALPELPSALTDEAIIGVGSGIGSGDFLDTATCLPVIRSASSKEEAPVVFMEEDGFTYVTLEASNSSVYSEDLCDGMVDDVIDARATSNSALQTTPSAMQQTPHSRGSMQTPYTYETIEASDAKNRTGLRSQFTFETIHSSTGKENAPNQGSSTTRRTARSTTRKPKRERVDLTQSPMQGRRICSVSPLPPRTTIVATKINPGTPQALHNEQMYRVDLDCFSIDEYASSPDKSILDCFSIDFYSSSDDGLGFGGTGLTALDVARTKRDQSLFRLRSMGGGKLRSTRPLPLPSPKNNSLGDINQRKDHVEKQRRRLSQVFQSYCQSMES